MMYPPPGDASSWFDRALRLVTDPRRRVATLVVVAYVAAVLGLGVAFFGGINNPTSDFALLGIVLLFVSFASLFYVSVTVITLEQGSLSK